MSLFGDMERGDQQKSTDHPWSSQNLRGHWTARDLDVFVGSGGPRAVGWVSFECVIIISTIKVQDRHLLKHSSHFIAHRAIFDLRLLNVSYLARVRKMEKRQDIQPDHFVDDFSLAKSSTRVTDAKKTCAPNNEPPVYEGYIQTSWLCLVPLAATNWSNSARLHKAQAQKLCRAPSADAKARGSKGVPWMAMGWRPWNKWFWAPWWQVVPAILRVCVSKRGHAEKNIYPAVFLN